METLLTDFSLLNLLIRFVVNLVVLIVLVRVIYYKYSRKEEFVFFHILLGNMIFLICSILSTINVTMGVAFGLFAIFALIRFRTVQFTVKDITYVFIVIGVSVVNSQANIPPPILSAIVINISVICLTCVLEVFLKKRNISSINLIYNNTEFLKPHNKAEMLKDISAYTGYKIESVIVKKIDIAKGVAEIEALYNNELVIDEYTTIIEEPITSSLQLEKNAIAGESIEGDSRKSALSEF